ncbi:ribonuclease H-like domain-containing protein, partial [Tanacetum coccineum]
MVSSGPCNSGCKSSGIPYSEVNSNRYSPEMVDMATAEEIVARERERKARTTLLMALPEDHLAKFHKMTDAKEMWDAIKSRFGGNDESKKMQKYILKQQFKGFFVSNTEGLHKGYDRFQSLLSQLEIHGAGVSTEDANQKFLRSLPSAWSQVSLIMRTKPGVDSLSFDDLYNNLRVFESDVKGSTASSSSPQNVAFVSENTSSTNDVSTAYCVPNPSGQNSQYEQTSSYSLLANQSSCPQLDHEDLEQIDEYDLEEMDLKWQVAMISMRMKKFYKKTGHFARECRIKGNQDNRRRDAWNSGTKDGSRTGKKEDSKALVTIDGEGVDWTNHSEEDEDYALMACNSSESDTEVTSCSNKCKESYANLKKLYDAQREQLSDASIEIKAYTQGLKKVEAQLVAHQQGQLQTVLTSTAMKVNTVKPIVNRVRPANVFHKTHSPSSRPFKKTTVLRTDFSKQKVNTAKVNAVSTVGGKRETAVKPSAGCNWRPQRYNWYNFSKYNGGSSLRNCYTFKDPLGRLKPKQAWAHNWKQGLLAVFQDLNRWPCCFWEVVKVISMNKVLFTDSECLVLSPEFKLPDENQVLLKVPRQNNMYSFNLENIVPLGGLACLIAKATTDESNKWHRRFSWVFFLRTKDETSGILKEFIRQIQNQLNHKVKTIRSDNGTEFKNKDVIEFCGSMGIKREYSNARTPQQNGVVERKNMTLIEAARTMLADSFLPNTFWAEAVSTACYVLNRVLVTKPHSKTPYELLTGKGPTWLFDLDYLTDSMNYHPVRSENQANLHAGQQEANQNARYKTIIDVGDSEKEDESDQDCFVLPIWPSYSSTTPALKSDDKREGPREEEQVFMDELERLKRANEEAEALRKKFEQETENLVIQEGAAKTSNTNIFSTVSTPATASSTNLVNTVSIPVSTASPHEGLSLSDPTTPEEDDSEIPPLEDIYQNSTDGIFTTSSYDHEGAVADFTNLETVVNDERAHLERPYEAQPTPSPAHTSEVPFEPHTDSSPAHTSAVPIEQQNDPSPRPSPSTIIPDSIPETSGGNLGGHSSSDKSLSGNEGEMTLQSVYDLCLSLCAQVSDQAKEIQHLKAQITKLKKQAKPVIKHHRAWLKSVSLKHILTRKSFSKNQRVHKESVSKQGRKFAKGEPSVQRDPLFDELPEDTVDHMETENAQDIGRTREIVDEEKDIDENILSTEDVVSTNKEKVSIDRPTISTDGSKVSTDKQIEGTDEQIKGTEEQIKSTDGQRKGTEDHTKEGSATQATQTPTSTIFGDDETIAKVLLNMSQAKAVSREKEKGVELKDIEETNRPRPTSTRLLLTLKPLLKIDLKDKGKKKIEEEDESESESDGIPEAEKKFKQLESDEEMARKIQEEWEGEEERNRIAEEKATNEALIRNFDDIKARIKADRLLAEKLQEQEREQFTIEERAKFLHDTIAAQRKFLAQQRSEAIRNRPVKPKNLNK